MPCWMLAGGLLSASHFTVKTSSAAPGPKAPLRHRPIRNGVTVLTFTFCHSSRVLGSCTTQRSPYLSEVFTKLNSSRTFTYNHKVLVLRVRELSTMMPAPG